MRRSVSSIMMCLLLVLLVFVSLFGCGGGLSASSTGEGDSKVPSTSVSIYKHAGSVQCAGGGVSLTDMQRQLTDAGIQVTTANCGSDGRMYAAVCGAPDGRIGIFEIPATKAEAASALGFAPLTALPEATRGACQ